MLTFQNSSGAKSIEIPYVLIMRLSVVPAVVYIAADGHVTKTRCAVFVFNSNFISAYIGVFKASITLLNLTRTR